MQGRGGAWCKTDDSSGCGGNLRSRNGELERETAESSQGVQPSGVRVFGLPLCTRFPLVEPLAAGNRYANGDPEFAKGNYQLDYYDRAEGRIVLVPIRGVTFLQDGP